MDTPQANLGPIRHSSTPVHLFSPRGQSSYLVHNNLLPLCSTAPKSTVVLYMLQQCTIYHPSIHAATKVFTRISIQFFCLSNHALTPLTCVPEHLARRAVVAAPSWTCREHVCRGLYSRLYLLLVRQYFFKLFSASRAVYLSWFLIL